MGTTGYLRFPTISRDQLVFTAEDDLWRVSVDGGRAERLTAGVAAATRARFSPDGRQIAFTGSDEGPDEVYVMPADGGPSRRLTYHAGRSEVVGWQPDGTQILYASSAGLPSPRWRMLSGVSHQGGEPVRLPYGIANAIAFGPNGAVVLGRNIREPAFWKRYRGGTAGYLWIDAQGTGEFKRLLDLNSNIAAPCWGHHAECCVKTSSNQTSTDTNVVYFNSWRISPRQLVHIGLRSAFSKSTSRLNWRCILPHIFIAGETG
jgi:tricorn protease